MSRRLIVVSPSYSHAMQLIAELAVSRSNSVNFVITARGKVGMHFLEKSETDLSLSGLVKLPILKSQWLNDNAARNKSWKRQQQEASRNAGLKFKGKR